MSQSLPHDYLNHIFMETTQDKNNATPTIIESWEIQSKQLKEKFPKLIDAYLKHRTSKESGISNILNTKLNKTINR